MSSAWIVTVRPVAACNRQISVRCTRPGRYQSPAVDQHAQDHQHDQDDDERAAEHDES